MFTSATDFARINAISIAESPTAPQVVYLDFDGAATSYANAEFGVAIDNVTVEESGISESDIAVIVDALNGMFDDVVFTSALPADGEFSTIYVGVTSAFDEYGTFLGLAETIDAGNQNRDDNAFVLLDSSAPAELVVSAIAHETEHIVHGMDHGGEGLERFAEINVGPGQNCMSTTLSNDRMNVYIAGMAISTTVNRGGGMNVYSNGLANVTTVNAGGVMEVYSGGIAIGTTVNNGGLMHVYSQGVANVTTVSEGFMSVYSGGIANGTTVNTGGFMAVYSGGTANGTTVSGARMDVLNYGTATSTTLNGVMYHIYMKGILNVSSGTATYTTVNDGGEMHVYNGGVANITTVNNDGEMFVDSGGTADRTTVNNGGWIGVYSGGSANITTINTGLLHIFSGGTHSGTLQIAENSVVDADTGATIDFTVAEQENRAVALINRYDFITGETPTFTITVSGAEEHGRYALAGYASDFNSTVTVKTTSGTEIGTLTVGGSLVSDNTIYSLTIDNQTLFLDVFNALLTNVKCQTDGNNAVVDWSGDETKELSRSYDARLSNGDGTLVVVGLAASGLELLNLPAGEMGVSVKPGLSDVWTELDAMEIPDAPDDGSIALSGVENGMAEVMFARGGGVWGGGYRAWHAGGDDLGSAGQTVELEGRNRLDDIFIGSDDATLLLLSDDTNGDALFVDDIYSAFPDGIDVQARVAKIDEIRAGAGDDVVDLTSPRFKYVGDGLTIRGGGGDDVIWANGGGNRLFGDAGNDRIVGGNGDDVIVGGVGNDVMHGGGGDDIFCFCGGWGNDAVEQTAAGKVTLWFAEGDESKWNAETLTYTDGENSVVVKGVASTNITLKFGDVGGQYSELCAAGAFAPFSSEKIFENKNVGMLIET